MGLVVSGDAASADLSSVDVSGTEPGTDGWLDRGIEVSFGGSLVSRGLLVEDNVEAGLVASHAGSRVDVEDVTIRGTRPQETGEYGRGVMVQESATLVARELSVLDNHDIGVFASGAGTGVEMRDFEVQGTRLGPQGASGRGIAVQEGAALLASAGVVHANHDFGLFVSGSGATAEVEDVEIRDTWPLPDGTFGRGVGVQGGARLIAGGLLLDANHDVGIVASDLGTSVELADLVVRNTQPLPDGRSGSGLVAQGGASVVLARAVLEGNRGFGILAAEEGTVVDLASVVVRDTSPPPAGTEAAGVLVQGGARLAATGLSIERSLGVGLGATGSGSVVEVQDAQVLDTAEQGDGTWSEGILVDEGARLSASDLAVEGTRGIGILAFSTGSVLELEGATVRDTDELVDGTCGWGIALIEGAALVARDLLLERNRGVAMSLMSPGTSAEFAGAVIRDTRPHPDGTFGRGIEVVEGARLVAEDLLVDGNHDVGMAVNGLGSTAVLSDSTISSTLGATDGVSGIGLVVQDDALVTASSLVLQGNDGPGAYVYLGGTLEAWDSSLAHNGFAGVAVFHAALRLEGGTVSESIAHPSEGGGVGVFGWDVWGSPDIEAVGVTFIDLPGPALYLRGQGRYRARGCRVEGSGTFPWLPGGVLAVEGVGRWEPVGVGDLFRGLLLEGNEFAALPGDAILLDGSSATLLADPVSGEANSFPGVGGEPLIWQRCGTMDPPEVLDGSVPEPSCGSPARALGPLLEYRLWLAEGEVQG